jgi:hypothetical protein
MVIFVSHWEPKRKMAGVTGLEPAASCVTGRRSNQLSYTPINGKAQIIDVCGAIAREDMRKKDNFIRAVKLKF